MAVDPETQTEAAPFTHDADILIGGEHGLVQLFRVGQTWNDVGSVITTHRRECHENDPED